MPSPSFHPSVLLPQPGTGASNIIKPKSVNLCEISLAFSKIVDEIITAVLGFKCCANPVPQNKYYLLDLH